MTPQERIALIEQLTESYNALYDWEARACIHSIGAPRINPATNEPFRSFREIIEAAHDVTLESLRDDFESNDNLLPPGETDV